MWHWGYDLGGWGWIWMSVMMLVVWVPLLVAVVWALRAFSEPRRGSMNSPDESGERPTARDLARLAYARGELDRTRYLEILEDLDRSERPLVRR